MLKEAQSLAVKRAQVEFHNFASLGEPERVLAVYAEENDRRRGLIRKYRDYLGSLTPFLEIGSNAGHTSYMLANEFGADGFALDISADSLRHGIALQELWGLSRAPIRVAGDALNLPFADGSMRLVMAYQMLSQFMDIESVFLEVKRVLAPGGVFVFSEEPLRRMLSLRLYRCPYYETMKPWERKLADWGLLGYLVRDVIGAHQEESFGIRQNHTMGLWDWRALIEKHFVDPQYEVFVPSRGWGERVVKRAAIRLDPYRSAWRAAHLLGGTLAVFCRKSGDASSVAYDESHFESLLRCPDCGQGLARRSGEALECTRCEFRAPDEGGVYNLLRTPDRTELYPGDQDDAIDFSRPSHADHLLDGWYDLEGIYGNKYRWIGERASAHLSRVREGPQKLRLRGHAQEGHPVNLRASVNGYGVGEWRLDRPGLFVAEADLPAADQYRIEIEAAPAWSAPGDLRKLTVNFSMIRLVPRE